MAKGSGITRASGSRNPQGLNRAAEVLETSAGANGNVAQYFATRFDDRGNWKGQGETDRELIQTILNRKNLTFQSVGGSGSTGFGELNIGENIEYHYQNDFKYSQVAKIKNGYIIEKGLLGNNRYELRDNTGRKIAEITEKFEQSPRPANYSKVVSQWDNFEKAVKRLIKK